jgi:dolichol kinase
MHDATHADAFTWRQELGRKAVHLGMMILPLWTYVAPEPWNWRGPFLAFLAFLTVDGVRLRSARAHGAFAQRIGDYLRADEARGPIRIHELTAAAALLAFMVPPAIAATAVAYAVFGDAAAALVGRRFGGGAAKSVPGSLACLATCIAIGAALLPGRPLAIAVGAAVATLVEAAPLPVDDNITVPLLAAVALVAIGM